MNRPIVVDANSLIVPCIRASALDDLRAGGIFTGGLYGGLKSLQSKVRLLRGGPVYAFFDCGVPAFRKKLFSEYKEKRDQLSPEDKERAYKQIVLFRKVLPMLGVRVLRFQNREADDGVAACVQVLTRQGKRPFVVSGDQDLFQLVDPDTSVLYLKNGTVIDYDSFEDSVGVPPDVYLLYKALVGDSSDNIKGASGCGVSRSADLVRDLIEGNDSVLNLDPDEQLDALCTFIETRKKKRRFEESIINEREWLSEVLEGIDLRRSFGDTKRLEELMSDPVSIDESGFRAFCRKYRLSSIGLSARSFLVPFVSALK